MTSEEAIKLINTMILAMCLSDPSIAIGEVEEVKTALIMAIKALQENPKLIKEAERWQAHFEDEVANEW